MPRDWSETIGAARWTREEAGESGGIIHRLTGRDGADLYLKYGEGAVADAIVDEAVRLRWLAGRVPAATVVRVAIEPGFAWLLTEAVPGRTGDAWLDDEPAALSPIIDGFADFLRRLHALPIDDCPFEAGAIFRLTAARARVSAGMVDEDDFDAGHSGWSAARVLAAAEALAGCANRRVVTHGDFSLGNLLFDEDGAVTGCIDVGRLGVADPYQDIAIFWQNLGDYGGDAQARFLRALGIATPDEQRLRFHRLLDELF